MPTLNAPLKRANEISDEIDDEGHQQKHQRAADAVKNRHNAGSRQAVGAQVGEGVDIAKLGPLFG
jgi:hypothetical protein